MLQWGLYALLACQAVVVTSETGWGTVEVHEKTGLKPLS